MGCGEFELIARYFDRKTSVRRDVEQGIGDDCALLQLSTKQTLAISTDTLVEGIHFLPSIAPADLAYKALAVNLSDLAAMGADPAWLTLALTLPSVDEAWLQAFSDSLFKLLEYFNMQLIGGDTTRGPLAMTLGIHGLVPEGQALKRSGAKAGDWIYVTGNLGDSAAGLALLLNQIDSQQVNVKENLIQRHLRPTPRVLQGKGLRTIASAAIDISDGLVADLRHILKASGVGANIYLESLPLSEDILALTSLSQAREWALSGGEDYELCFTVPDVNRGAVDSALKLLGTAYCCIGQVTGLHQSIRLFDYGQEVNLKPIGFQHFSPQGK